MNRLHQTLTQKYPKYNNWHQTKHHNKIHWGVFVVFTLLIFGMISRWTPISLAADTVAPTTPANLTATAISSSQINLSWTASTDDTGVTGYKIYRCAGSACAPTVQISTSAANSYSNTGLTASTAYIYAVSAYDAAGNESGKSALASATTLAQTGNVYYVDQNHPQAADSNPGTEALPWETIQKAADTLIAGDTVLVRAGLYSMQGELGSVYSQYGIYPKNSGISGSPIIYKVYPGENVIIDQGNQYAGFLIANKSNITISGFEIQNLYGSGVGTHDNASYITVENSVIHDANAPAGANIGAISFNFCSRCTARGNKLYNVSVNGDMSSQNASAIGNNYHMEYAIIENNEMFNTANGVFHKRSSGNKGAIIRNNLMHDLKNDCIRYSVGGVGDPPHIDQEVYQNICYNTPIGISATTFETSSPSTGFNIHNNVFHNQTGGIAINGYKDINIWNNIFFEGGTNYYERAISTTGEPAINSVGFSDYNIFYPPARFLLNTYSSSEIAYNTLSAWQSGIGFDLNSLNSNPLFVDVLERNYHLQSTSPEINAGIDRQDYDGDGDTAERINMGAYITGNEVIGVIGIGETRPPLDTTPPTGTLSINAGAAYLNSTSATLSLSATDSGSGMGAGAQMQFSNDNTTWSTAEAYSTSKAWTLSAGDGLKTVYAKYKDTAGNWMTTAVSGTIILDATLPILSISAPTAGSAVSGASIIISAAATDTNGIAGVQFKLDGANLGAEDTTSPYSITWDTTIAANSAHTLTAIARDNAGNSATSSAVNITVNNILPDTQAPTTPTGLTVAAISSSQINLSWTASTDDVGVAGYKIYRDDILRGTIDKGGGTSYSDTGLTASTAYTYAVSAYDAAGNESGKSSSISATTLAGFKPSDLNQDQKVDQLDFDILKQDWKRTDKPKSDLNQDGIVDSRDLGIMMSEWTR